MLIKCLSVFALALTMTAASQAQNPAPASPQEMPQGNPQRNPPPNPQEMMQNKLSGTLQCGKPEQQHTISVGDRPGHNLAIGQMKCTWTKPLEIAGSTSKDGVSSVFTESTGTNSRVLGYHVSNMSNGDNFFVRYQGMETLKDGAPQSEEGRWSFGSSSGKLKGLRGQGSYKCTISGEGATCEVEGGYMLPKF